jgi:hypothetical protein
MNTVSPLTVGSTLMDLIKNIWKKLHLLSLLPKQYSLTTTSIAFTLSRYSKQFRDDLEYIGGCT